MKIKLVKKELEQLLGGASSSITPSDVSTEKRNTNRTEFCQCKYLNMSATSNVNNVYACNCVCV
ncbi:MAG: hypothetical protein LBV02_06505 [Bacteroidales bacterium]|jgi:hypothetical protein|nr:hypothetical protein [Bacteroidales bacterium]